MNNATANSNDKSVTTASLSAVRHIGFCAFCEGDWKLAPDKDGAVTGKLVHHGYKRPGDGNIAGDCLGVGQAPYEVSAEPLKVYLGRLQAGLREQIAAREQHLCTHYFEVWGVSWATKKMVCDSYAKGVTPEHVWNHVHEAKLKTMNSHIEGQKREIARIEKHIAAWTPKAIRSVEELVIKKELAKKASEEKRAAAKKARDEKKAALQAKKDKRAADIAAFIADIQATANALAKRYPPIMADRSLFYKDLAKLLTKVKKADKTYSITKFDGLSALGCDDALVTLGLARRELSVNGRVYLRPAW